MPVRSGKIKIKRYRTGRNKIGLLLLILLLSITLLWFFLQKKPDLKLPSFLTPSLTREDMAADSRVITLPGSRFFALQLGAFSDVESAKALAASYQNRGAAGYIYDKDSFRVLAAAYDSRESAQAVQQQLSQNHGVDAYLFPIDRTEITLRLSGQKAQLNALSDAFDLCSQLTISLSQISQSLDQGTMAMEEALTALSSQQETIRALNARLLSLFKKEKHEAVTRLSSLLQETDQCLAQAAKASSSTKLGSAIKYSQLSLICGLESYVLSLTP